MCEPYSNGLPKIKSRQLKKKLQELRVDYRRSVRELDAAAISLVTGQGRLFCQELTFN